MEKVEAPPDTMEADTDGTEEVNECRKLRSRENSKDLKIRISRVVLGGSGDTVRCESSDEVEKDAPPRKRKAARSKKSVWPQPDKAWFPSKAGLKWGTKSGSEVVPAVPTAVAPAEVTAMAKKAEPFCMVPSAEIKSSRKDVFAEGVDRIHSLSSKMTAYLIKNVETSNVEEGLQFIREYEKQLFVILNKTAMGLPKKSVEEVSVKAGPSYAAVASTSSAGLMFPPFQPTGRPSRSRSVRARSRSFTCTVAGKSNETADVIKAIVAKSVLPVSGARVIRTMVNKTGQVIISAPTAADRDKIMLSAKANAMTAEVKEQLSTRFKLLYVPKELPTEDIMEELGSRSAVANYANGIKVASRKEMNIDEDVLLIDMNDAIAEEFRAEKRIFIKWFSFPAYEVQKPAFTKCYRCLGAHMVSSCKQKDVTCANCGQIGHTQDQCQNKERCRDCDMKKMNADHKMHSNRCPVFVDRMKNINRNGY